MAFLGFYLSISFIPASISALLEAVAGPICITLLSLKTSVRKNNVLLNLLFPLAIFLLGLIALLIQVPELSYKTLIGFSLSVLAAFGAALISMKSYVLSSVSPYIILAHRFHLTWIISACLLFGYYDFDLSRINLLSTIILVCLGVVLPMYFLQKGIQKIKPMITMVALSIIPMVTYMAEAFIDRNFYIDVVVILLVSTTLSLLYIFKSEKK
ncbi:hypothetical protein [Mannheimia pernigra]|uniref:hypothetical protein n=1 Tax=Mannheimia pernigra TaxID=111844 RepID=UPI0013169CFF|nr:hypothetical protein [Mannheimia pernigra]QHB18338.1 hypothetical protein GM695_10090 [Mannheimia pernigra]